MRKESTAAAAIHRLVWPICLIGAKHRGKHNVMTIAWVTQVSVDPLLVVASISPTRYTHDMIVHSGEFMLSILTSEQKDISSFCGFRSGRDIDKIAHLRLKTVPASVIGVPRLADCLANLECKVVDRHLVGDHTLFVGEVVAADVAEQNLQPLLMCQGKTLKLAVN
jgi:flavin reductase (DIM6/NTAB) family NADH-FMN oxidoreductase RutF